jgi:hypothetical protein
VMTQMQSPATQDPHPHFQISAKEQSIYSINTLNTELFVTMSFLWKPNAQTNFSYVWMAVWGHAIA